MKKLIVSFLFLSMAFTLSGCMTKMEVATDLLLIADWAQTRQIPDRADVYEKNVFLGPDPSKDKIDNYFMARLAVNTAIHRFLPKKQLKFYQWAVVIDQLYCIKGNVKLGLKIKF